MSQTENLLSTQEFAKQAGVSASTISKWLRSGKLKGKKQGGKWMIAATELNTIGAAKSSKPPKKIVAKTKTTAPKTAKASKSSAQSYSVEEFSQMTYLTEFGVRKWIKEGKISITRGPSGEINIDAVNLENTYIKRVIRK